MNLQNQNSKSKVLTTLFAMLCFVLMGQAATADSLTAPSGVDAASEIQTYGKYFDNAPDVAVSFQQGEYLMVKTSSKSGISVAEVVEQGEDVYLRELRWADDFHDPALDGDLGRVPRSVF